MEIFLLSPNPSPDPSPDPSVDLDLDLELDKFDCGLECICLSLAILRGGE